LTGGGERNEEEELSQQHGKGEIKFYGGQDRETGGRKAVTSRGTGRPKGGGGKTKKKKKNKKTGKKRVKPIKGKKKNKISSNRKKKNGEYELWGLLPQTKGGAAKNPFQKKKTIEIKKKNRDYGRPSRPQCQSGFFGEHISPQKKKQPPLTRGNEKSNIREISVLKRKKNQSLSLRKTTENQKS